ncbi:hypothetical protein L53_12995 [Hyphomonas sp. L-53-1-40]|uniref:thymidylate synthase n=1 Tax=Hyphomonas sp. L-53-1-40 TaxID=1207058 RepID=UPI00045916D5|nr:thymidylate synthase [Hyphomonas sp. L-53-1-40]KCZ62153.1 hypothetical protein L53_12995 [Hyphomonas sp. L-53-1-40]
MYINKETLDDLLRAVLTELLANGSPIDPTRAPAVELAGVLLEIGNPRARLSRTETKGKAISCVGELLWYLSGSDSAEHIRYYIPLYAEESEDGETIYGAYGPRLLNWHGQNQLQNVINLLKVTPNTRRAVIQIFDALDIGERSTRRKEIPCTCMLQFLLRDNQLQLIVNMRSNDAHLGLAHDVFAFTMLQEIVARSLGVEIGTYKHFVGSLHLYNRDRAKAEKFLSEGFQPTNIPMPEMPSGDPWDSIEKMLRVEQSLRSNEKCNLSDFDLPLYWQDLARLLAIFAASRAADAGEAQKNALEIGDPAYKIYIESRVK